VSLSAEAKLREVKGQGVSSTGGLDIAYGLEENLSSR
jgi:hypothetical protein